MLVWSPTVSVGNEPFVLVLLGGSSSTAQGIIGCPPDAGTLTARVVSDAIADGQLPEATLVLAIGSDAYSRATSIETAVSDLTAAADRVARIVLVVEREVLGRELGSESCLVAGASYGATVTANILVRCPNLANGWALLSGLPWLSGHMSPRSEEDAALIAGALSRNRGANVLTDAGLHGEGVLCRGFANIHAAFAHVAPDAAYGRWHFCLSHNGEHTPRSFALELRDALMILHRDTERGLNHHEAQTDI